MATAHTTIWFAESIDDLVGFRADEIVAIVEPEEFHRLGLLKADIENRTAAEARQLLERVAHAQNLPPVDWAEGGVLVAF